MTMFADLLMGFGAMGAAIYCMVLSARLRRFTALESGMGSAIAVLSAQVDDMTRVLDAARKSAAGSAGGLDALVARAERTASRLEVILAAMHDLDDGAMGTDRRLRLVRRRSPRPAEMAEAAP